MTTQEIHSKAINLINEVIVLSSNVKNGCYSDKVKLDVQLPRLTAIRKWAEENNMLIDIRHYLSNKNFGMTHQFSANEISKLFY